MNTKYQVIDGHHGTVVGTYSSSKRAHTKADQLNAEYGGYRYGVPSITENSRKTNIAEAAPKSIANRL